MATVVRMDSCLMMDVTSARNMARRAAVGREKCRWMLGILVRPGLASPLLRDQQHKWRRPTIDRTPEPQPGATRAESWAWRRRTAGHFSLLCVRECACESERGAR